MPVVNLTTEHAAEIVACVNSAWADQRKRGHISGTVTDWDEGTVKSFMGSGVEFWGYQPSDKGGVIDCVCAFHVSMMVSPFGSAEPWMNLPILAVREELDHDARIKANTVTLLGAVPSAVKQGAIGITSTFDMRNQELRGFVDAWNAVPERPTQTIWEMQGGMQRFWLRLAPDLAGLKAKSVQLGVDKEPVASTDTKRVK